MDIYRELSEKLENHGPIVEVYEHEGMAWSRNRVPLSSMLQTGPPKKIRIVSISFAQEKFPETHYASISKALGIPLLFWCSPRRRASGFFGNQTNCDSSGKIQSYDTWLCFEAKQVFGDLAADTEGASYAWSKIAIFTSWNFQTNASLIVCFDSPEGFPTQLKEALTVNAELVSLRNPYVVHHVVLEEVLALYDKCVWSMRDAVREVEQNRTAPNAPNPDYPRLPRLHHLARHVIHSTETLDVAIDTVDNMMKHHLRFSEEEPPISTGEIIAFRKTRDLLCHQHGMFKLLRNRSNALEARLRNEISLAFHTVAQYDSRIAVRIGQAAQNDSAATKTIAVMTLLFLPGTFVSAIFSMGFYNFDPTNPESGWRVSHQIWVYWAISIPLTIVTVISWLVWQRRFSKRKVDS